MADVMYLDGVTKAYGSFVAVDNLFLQIRQGEVFGLLGPNGAGKTSSIRMMLGITVPDRGAVRLFGEDFHLRQLERVGYLPEERGLYKKMGVEENLVFFSRLKGLRAGDAAQRARLWLERLELDRWAKTPLEELSKGMQQKVQFIAAILHEPDFMILDEPFSGLDPSSALQLKNILLELKKEGRTILFSTHRMETVERLCDSICLINHGQRVLAGALRTIKKGYGRSRVQLEYEGQLPLLSNPALVAGFNDFGNYVELRLAPGASPQQLLEQAVRFARILRFEMVEPSLEEIFLEKVESTQRVNAYA